MSEIVSNSLFVSLIDDTTGLGHCYFSLNNSNPLKFYSSSDILYYSPPNFDFRLVQQVDNVVNNLLGGVIKIIVTGLNKTTNTNYRYEQIYAQDTNDTIYSYTFPTVSTESSELINIEKIILEGSYQNQIIAREEIPIIYGTNEQMAKFALVANGIYASVDEAGLEFTAEGLTIKNGNIVIENKTGEQVFKVDDDGNLSFKGTINSQKGLLSGWVLKENE